MSSKEINLGKLLNSESFLRWLKGEASSSESKKWNQWLSRNPKHNILTKKSQKLLSMPFKIAEEMEVEAEELQKLRKRISEYIDKNESVEKE